MNFHIQRNKSGKKSSRGFYIALGVCLIAVGVAAWTTYDSVVNYANPQDGTQSETEQTNNTVSGIFVSEPESSQPEASSRPVSQAPSRPESRAPASSSQPAVSSAAPAKPADATVQTYTYPVGKTVVQKYNEDPVYCDTTQDWRAHTGVDLSAGAGETVKAIADGTVKKVYRDDQYGNTVVVTHGDVEAWYRGLDEMSVKEGASVKQGQKIGTVGVVPVENKEASHLHLEIRKNGKYVDPLTVLQ